MTLEDFNSLEKRDLKIALEKCCGAKNWVSQMAQHHPYDSVKEIYLLADQYWYRICTQEDWREAFLHHPEIGDIKSLAKKFASTSNWAGQEQSGINNAKQEILEGLAKGNKDYKEKFGFIFIVCATGKSAAEMLALLNARLPNDPDFEIKIAMAEQAKITKIRLEKLLS